MSAYLATVRNVLPAGRTLPETAWWARHRGILLLLWIHSVVIPIFALSRGFSLIHSLAEGLVVPAATIVASLPGASRRVRTFAASIGLLSASAVLVHLSGGVIEMHFHFFVTVAIVSLYQDWVPFLAAIGYVLLHHGILGALDPSSVFNHPAAIAHPWRWAAIHAAFIAGISVASLVNWRLNETILAQRRRAEARLREESQIVETLHDVGKALAEEHDLQRVVQRVTDAATMLTKAEFGAFFYNSLDERGESYLLYTLSGAPVEAFAGFPMPRNTAVFGPTFAGDGVIRLGDVTQDARYGHNPPYHGMPDGHLPVTSYLGVPVISRTGEVIGGLFFGHSEPDRFDEVAERLAVGIASHAALAIDGARVYQQERQARAREETAHARLAVLEEAGRTLTSSLELDAILDNLCRLAVASVAGTCVVDLVEDDGRLRRFDPASEMAESPAPWRVAVHQAIETATRVEIGGGGEPAALAVPLVGRQGVFGAVTVTPAARAGGAFSPEDITLTEELARRAAIALENARLYHRQRSAAETLQCSLLPERLPELPGVATAARYVPGGPGVSVGGDWYDVFELSSGDLALAMGDVVGRGIPAASLMGQLRNALRAYALEGHGPSEVLNRLNRLLHELGSAEQMATLVYLVFDLETGTLRSANAGHPPPLLVGPDGVPVYLDAGSGFPLGAVASATYPEGLTALTPGSTIVLYTDGLVEDRNISLDAGLDRLCRAVVTSPEGLGPLCDHVLRQALEGREGTDDVAVLAMKWSALDDHLDIRMPARPASLRPLRATLRRWLAAAGAAEDEAYEILVATGEACANAIQHAGPSATSEFELHAEKGDGITVRVCDEGRWREPRHDGVGGRGLPIMHSFMDEVDVVAGEEGTEVRMHRRLSRVDGTAVP